MKLLDENITILAQKWGHFLHEKKWKCATAESCSGGGIAFALTGIRGSSGWFERGLVTYSNLSKEQLLAVPKNILDQYGAVSRETAEKMAEGALANSDADMAISVTGIAGPDGGTDAKPVGTIWFGFAAPLIDTKSISQYFTGNRDAIRLATIHYALTWGYDLMREMVD